MGRGRPKKFEKFAEKFAIKLNFAKLIKVTNAILSEMLYFFYINCCMIGSISMRNYQNPSPPNIPRQGYR